MSDRKPKAKDGGTKTASKREKNARGSSRRGMGSPKRGSHRDREVVDTLAIPTFRPLSGSPDPLPGSPTPPPALAEPEEPFDDSPITPHFPSSVRDLNEFRRPPMKDVGRDENGRVIPHVRDEEVAKMVYHWTGLGADVNFIAAQLNIRPGLLKECYPKELAHGVMRANMEVAGSAFRVATMDLPETSSIKKFWLKARANWRDTDNKEDNNLSLFNINIHL